MLGFQGKAQLEYLYGHLAEVMLSQPATSVWLKTKEPKAGEWVSKFIGKVEVERLRETHFDGTRAGQELPARPASRAACVGVRNLRPRRPSRLYEISELCDPVLVSHTSICRVSQAHLSCASVPDDKLALRSRRRCSEAGRNRPVKVEAGAGGRPRRPTEAVMESSARYETHRGDSCCV